MKHLKTKQKLIAKSECEMNEGSGKALIIGKEYEVSYSSVSLEEIAVKSELFEKHFFSTNPYDDHYWGLFFNEIKS